MPEIGTCWRMSPAKAADKDHWFDDSPRVPCTERHTLETVAVYPLASPAPELALEQLADRDQEGRLFIGTLILEDPDSYPSPRELRVEGDDCQVALRDPAYVGLALRVLWRPPADMGQDPGIVTGSCRVHRPDGQDLPPLR